MSKSFEVAVNRAIREGQGEDEEQKPLTFHFADDPDTELEIYPPDENQLALFLSLVDGMVSGTTQVSTVINLFSSMMATEDGKSYVRRRLLTPDRVDPFGVMDLLPVFQWTVEESVGRPTKPSSDSSSSPATNGQRSAGRARRAESTRSSSTPTSSSTSSTPTSSKGSRTGKSSTSS